MANHSAKRLRPRPAHPGRFAVLALAAFAAVLGLLASALLALPLSRPAPDQRPPAFLAAALGPATPGAPPAQRALGPGVHARVEPGGYAVRSGRHVVAL